jgi:hypothetical protein
MMRGTIWITPTVEGAEDIPQTVPVLRFVKTLDATNAPEFMERVRREYPNPDVEVSFGPIGAPWK